LSQSDILHFLGHGLPAT